MLVCSIVRIALSLTKTTAKILPQEIVVFTGKILAELLYENQVTEADLLTTIVDIEKNHNTEIEYFINQRHNGYSALWLALLRRYKKVCAKIMLPQMTADQFCENFKSTEAENISYPFPVLLEFDIESLPPSVQSIASELFLRKKLALITSMEGSSKLFDISWEMEGHHDYSAVGKFYFESLSENAPFILDKLDPLLLEISEDEKTASLACLNETMVSIKNIPQDTPDLTGTICPFLVGTKAGIQGLHAEGFVIYNNEYLFLYVERSNPQKSGIIGYKFDPDFVQSDEFHDFLKKVLSSTTGEIENALDFESYASYTTANDHFEETGLYIEMSKQNKGNCTTASSEGIFVATLFCHLLEEGLTEKRAIELSKQCSEFFFRENKIVEIKKFLQHAIEKYPNESPAYQQELVLFVGAVRAHAEKNKLSDDEATALFKQFDERREIQEMRLNQRLLDAQQAFPSTTLEPDSLGGLLLTPQRLAETAQQPSSSSPTEVSPTPATPPVQQNPFDSASSPAP